MQHGKTDRDERKSTSTHRSKPVWWTKTHDSSWDHVKQALRRDWEQTKHDVGGKAPDLKQDVPDTVKQAAGSERIPPGTTPNYKELEPAFRFGHGARMTYSKDFPRWDGSLETKLRADYGLDFERHREAIRYGYEYAND